MTKTKTIAESTDDAWLRLANSAPHLTLAERLAAVKAAGDCIVAGHNPAALVAENTTLKARVTELEAAAATKPPASKVETPAALKSLSPDQLLAIAARLLAENTHLKAAATKPATAMTLTERAIAAMATANK